MEFEFGDYIWTKDENDNWQYKKRPNKLAPRSLASDRRYKDAPRYKVVIQYENLTKHNFLNNTLNMIKDISKKVMTFSD